MRKVDGWVKLLAVKTSLLFWVLLLLFVTQTCSSLSLSFFFSLLFSFFNKTFFGEKKPCPLETFPKTAMLLPHHTVLAGSKSSQFPVTLPQEPVWSPSRTSLVRGTGGLRLNEGTPPVPPCTDLSPICVMSEATCFILVSLSSTKNVGSCVMWEGTGATAYSQGWVHCDTGLGLEAKDSGHGSPRNELCDAG